MCIIFLILEKIVFEIYIKFVDNVFFVVFFVIVQSIGPCHLIFPPTPLKDRDFWGGGRRRNFWREERVGTLIFLSWRDKLKVAQKERGGGGGGRRGWILNGMAHFHRIVLCVWSCNSDLPHVRIFVTPCSFYVLLQSDGKARCFLGIWRRNYLLYKNDISRSLMGLLGSITDST